MDQQWLIVGSQCGRDKNGTFRCVCGRCRELEPEEALGGYDIRISPRTDSDWIFRHAAAGLGIGKGWAAVSKRSLRALAKSVLLTVAGIVAAHIVLALLLR